MDEKEDEKEKEKKEGEVDRGDVTGKGGVGAMRLPSLRCPPLLEEKDSLLDERLRRRLAEIGTLRRLPAGTPLQEEGEKAVSILNLVEGIVATYRLSDEGERRILSFHFPGDLIGLLEKGRYVNSARALTPIVAYVFPTAAFLRFLGEHPGVEEAFLAKAHQDLREAEQHALMLARREAHERLLLLLDLLRKRLPVKEGEGGAVVLDLPLRRADIADYLGLSVEAVSRAFGRLEEEGYLRLLTPRRVELLPLSKERVAALA